MHAPLNNNAPPMMKSTGIASRTAGLPFLRQNSYSGSEGGAGTGSSRVEAGRKEASTESGGIPNDANTWLVVSTKQWNTTSHI